jgi:hypothetical protein
LFVRRRGTSTDRSIIEVASIGFGISSMTSPVTGSMFLGERVFPRRHSPTIDIRRHRLSGMLAVRKR